MLASRYGIEIVFFLYINGVLPGNEAVKFFFLAFLCKIQCKLY